MFLSGWEFSVVVVFVLVVAWLFFGPQRIKGAHYGAGYNPFTGSLVSIYLNSERIHDWKLGQALEAVATKKPMFGWSLPFQAPSVELVTQEGVEHLLKGAFDNFEKSAFFADRFMELLNKGIFNVDGELWREQRKIASHMFSAKVLNDKMLQVFTEHAHELCDILDSHIKTNPNGTIDMQQMFHSYTFDAICEIAFGVKLDCIHQIDQPFQKAFDSAQECNVYRFFDPPIVWKLRRLFQLGFESRLTKDLQVLNDFVFKIVRERKANKEKYQDANDLLSLFITDAAKRGEELSDVYLRDIIMNFMIAGRDTTASTLTYFFYTLSLFPECERKVVEEVNDVLRGSEPTHDLLKKLVYTECAINENIRLNPPVPGDLKVAVKDTAFPSGVIVPKGASVGYSPYLFSRLPTVWGPDAAEYKPERWLEEDADGKQKVAQPSQFKFISFNAGPRLCLGKPMAMMEAKTCAAMLLQKFVLRPVPNHNPAYRLTVALQMRHGLPMTIKRRENEY